MNAKRTAPAARSSKKPRARTQTVHLNTNGAPECRARSASVTTDRSKITCANCKRSRIWKKLDTIASDAPESTGRGKVHLLTNHSGHAGAACIPTQTTRLGAPDNVTCYRCQESQHNPTSREHRIEQLEAGVRGAKTPEAAAPFTRELAALQGAPTETKPVPVAQPKVDPAPAPAASMLGVLHYYDGVDPKPKVWACGQPGGPSNYNGHRDPELVDCGPCRASPPFKAAMELLAHYESTRPRRVDGEKLSDSLYEISVMEQRIRGAHQARRKIEGLEKQQRILEGKLKKVHRKIRDEEGILGEYREQTDREMGDFLAACVEMVENPTTRASFFGWPVGDYGSASQVFSIATEKWGHSPDTQKVLAFIQKHESEASR